jgi:hypothetical protein
MRTAKKDVIPALIKVCFGNIQMLPKLQQVNISKVCGVKRFNSCDVD